MEEFITDSYKSSTGDSVTQSYVYKPDNQGMKPRHEETSFEAMKHPGFAKRFREACRDNKLPPRQKEVSKFLQTTTTTAWNYLNGEKLPSMESAADLEKLSIATKADLEKLANATKADLEKLEARIDTKISAAKTDLLKWLIGLLFLQAGFIVTLIKLL